MSIVSISITGPDVDWLAGLANTLVSERLAACGNIIPTIRSIYRWEGTIEDDAEAFLILHTQRHHVTTIIERTNDLHPYDTAQILATDVIEADPAYAQWVITETTPDPSPAE